MMNEQRRMLYLIGYPGAGKSTLLRAALEDVKPYYYYTKPFAFSEYPGGALLGAEHKTYPGTDRLSMGVLPIACSWLQFCSYSLVIGEGDRLNNRKFFETALALRFQVHLVWIDVSEELSRERCNARGSDFSEFWYKGRLTHVQNMALWANGMNDLKITRLDGSKPFDELSAQLRLYPEIVQMKAVPSNVSEFHSIS